MTINLSWLGAVALAILTSLAPAGEPSKAAAGGEGGGDVLNLGSYWRWHASLKPPEYSEGGKLVPLKPPSVWGVTNVDRQESPAAPEGWAGADFDDSDWPRSRLEWARRPAFSRYSVNRVFFRGKFAVTDPESAKLTLGFNYVGGALVYVNGQELCRASLPAGKLEADTPAELYPDDAFVAKNGKAIPGGDRVKKAPANEKSELEAGIAKRRRSLAPVEIPAKLLRKGTNVLAIEIRRAPYHAISQSWFSKGGQDLGAGWFTAGIDGVKLQAGGSGAVANTARPAGLQIWNQDRCDRLTLADYGDPNEKLGPVKIFGARNGLFCGQLALGSTEALTGIGATASALKGPKGEIPAADVAVLYGAPCGFRVTPGWFLNLTTKPPAQAAADKQWGGAVQQVLLRVKIPKEAAAGLYKGTLTVSASGKSFQVPMEVNVSDWTLPDPGDYRTYVGIYQSPISVAMQYNVKPWSEEHWKYMDRSFELLGRLGNKTINVSVVDETQFGEPEGMIAWVKKGENSYEYDFALFDRYLAMAMKHCGKQDYVCLQIWHAGGWSARGVDNKCTVQVKDPATGKCAPMQVPLWGKPEAVAFWKPFFAAMQARLEKLGMPGAMTVGILSDSTAPNEVFQTMSDAWPDGTARWHRGCHSATGSKAPYSVAKAGKNMVTLHEHCYGMSMVDPDVEPLPPIHEFRGRPATAYHRISNEEVYATLLTFKQEPEFGIWCQKQGVGRLCLDFWNVMKTKGGSDTGMDVYNRYPHSSCAQREPSLKKMTWPGPQGAEPDVNYEAFAEGIEELEAAMVLSRAAAKPEVVGKELAEKCKSVLRERLMFCHARDYQRWGQVNYHLDHYGWQDLAKRTFDLAGEVSAKLGK